MDGLIHFTIHACSVQCYHHCKQCCGQVHSAKHHHYHDLWRHQVLDSHGRMEVRPSGKSTLLLELLGHAHFLAKVLI